MKIIVTGCCGFIGSHVTETLLKLDKSYRVYGIDNMNDYYSIKQKRDNLAILEQYTNFRFYREDIRTTNLIEQLKPDKICHLAAMAGVRNSLDNPSYYADVNITGFINILDQVIKIGKHIPVIYASSSSVYGLNTKIPFHEADAIDLPNSPYAVSKRCMEIYADYYARAHKMQLIGLRFFTVYGPRGRPDMAPYKFLKAIIRDELITKYGTGESFRDYTYISDIVSGIIKAIGYTKNPINPNLSEDHDLFYSKIFNLGAGSPITLNKFIETCEQVTGKTAKIAQLNDQIGDVPGTFADITLARDQLGYNPEVKLDQGLSSTYKWLQQQNDQTQIQ